MPRFVKKIELTSLDGVELRIYTIGYSRQGESILTLLCQGSEILFSILTDSFQIQSKDVLLYNALNTIMEHYRNGHIDVFVWTHPDYDHSVGIKDVLEKFDSEKKAFIYIPITLDQKDKYALSDSANSAYTYIMDNYRGKVDSIGLMDGTECSGIDVDVVDLSAEISIGIKGFFMAPSSSLALSRSYGEKGFTMNDLSIVYSLCVNKRNLLFTGDVEGLNVKRLCAVHLNNVIFHKIPHHGSQYSSQLGDKLLSLGNRSVTQTVTQKFSTPSKDELQKYAPLGEIWVASDDSQIGCYCGVVRTRYDLKTMQRIEPPSIWGNAYKM